jgi:hypothetical protein
MVDYAPITFALPREFPHAFGNGSFVLPIRTPSELTSCGAALYRPIAASISSLNSALANDGDPTTSWTTPTSGVSGEWWVVIDLGEGKSVYSVSVAWGVAHPASYTIDVGDDGSSWAVVHNESGGAGYAAGQQPELTSLLRVPPSARWLRVRSSAAESVAPTANLIETGITSAGGWGGTCTCPDGQVY